MKRKTQIFMIIIMTLVMMIESPTAVYATTYADLEQDLRDMEDEQEDIEEGMESTYDEIGIARNYLADIYSRINVIEEEILAVDLEITTFTDKITAKEEEIELTNIALEHAKIEELEYHEQIAERIKVMYEYGDVGYWEVLLESENLSDFFTRLEYVTQIFNYDEKMLENLAEMQEAIYAKETQMEIERLDLDIILSELEVKKALALDLYEDKAVEIDLIEATQVVLDQQMLLLEQMEEEIEKAILEKVSEMENFLVWTDGTLDWPAPGQTRITSQFGWRVHPIFGTRKMHNGVDIGMPYGTDIVAAERGVVVRAEYNSSYGNVIMIDHGTFEGSHYYTLYAHNSKLLVVEGQEVNRGQHISEAGSTGNSTGVHLHFGVMKDDGWVNPLDFFDKNN